MSNQYELIRQIAVDVAVIKTELNTMKELSGAVKAQQLELSKVKVSLSYMKWLGGLTSTAIIGLIIRITELHTHIH